MKKILIIRFSSIGDIILTSPILRCLKNQTDNTIHYLIKEKYRMVIESNPYIDKIHSFNGHNFHIISELKSENYDLIIDLQNSINSWWIKLNLNTLSNTVRKKNWEKFLLIYFGLDYLGDHVVDRYFSCIKNISINNDDKGLDFYLKNKIDVNFNTNQHFIAWSIGGSFSTKKLSAFQIIEVCNNLNENIVLLGGEGEKDLGSSIIKGSNNTKIYNFCGELSLDETAYLIQKSQLV